MPELVPNDGSKVCLALPGASHKAWQLIQETQQLTYDENGKIIPRHADEVFI